MKEYKITLWSMFMYLLGPVVCLGAFGRMFYFFVFDKLMNNLAEKKIWIMTIILLLGCSSEHPTKEDFLGVWTAEDGYGRIEFFPDGTFRTKDLSAKKIHFNTGLFTDSFIFPILNEVGRWDVEYLDGQGRWVIQLGFPAGDNIRSGFSMQLNISGTQGILGNQPPWYLYNNIDSDLPIYYVFTNRTTESKETADFSKEDFIGTWIGAEGTEITFFEDSTFSTKRIPQDTLYDGFGKNTGIITLETGKWNLKDVYYRKRWIISLQFDKSSNLPQGLITQLEITGSQGAFQNKPPWKLYDWTEKFPSEQYFFIKSE